MLSKASFDSAFHLCKQVETFSISTHLTRLLFHTDLETVSTVYIFSSSNKVHTFSTEPPQQDSTMEHGHSRVRVTQPNCQAVYVMYSQCQVSKLELKI